MLGMAMALVFMVSTAIAIAVLYVAARIQGRPFGVKAYWAERQAGRSGRPGYGYSAPHSGGYPRAREKDVIDVEAREIP